MGQLLVRDINNLAGMLRALGDLDGAKTHFERALRIFEATYGPPTTRTLARWLPTSLGCRVTSRSRRSPVRVGAPGNTWGAGTNRLLLRRAGRR